MKLFAKPFFENPHVLEKHWISPKEQFVDLAPKKWHQRSIKFFRTQHDPRLIEFNNLISRMGTTNLRMDFREDLKTEVNVQNFKSNLLDIKAIFEKGNTPSWFSRLHIRVHNYLQQKFPQFFTQKIEANKPYNVAKLEKIISALDEVPNIETEVEEVITPGVQEKRDEELFSKRPFHNRKLPRRSPGFRHNLDLKLNPNLISEKEETEKTKITVSIQDINNIKKEETENGDVYSFTFEEIPLTLTHLNEKNFASLKLNELTDKILTVKSNMLGFNHQRLMGGKKYTKENEYIAKHFQEVKLEANSTHTISLKSGASFIVKIDKTA